MTKNLIHVDMKSIGARGSAIPSSAVVACEADILSIFLGDQFFCRSEGKKKPSMGTMSGSEHAHSKAGILSIS